LENKQHILGYAKRTLVFLTLILFFKVLGYFTLSENITITRVVKIVLRFSMTGFTWLIYVQLQNRGHIASFLYRNTQSLYLYLSYLMLGLISLFWSTNPGYSALQLSMNAESLFFTWLYLKTFILFRHHYQSILPAIRLSYVFNYGVLGIVLIFIIGFFYNPDDFIRLTHGGAEKRLGGYLMNPNELGMLAVVGMGACLTEFKYKTNKMLLALSFLIILYALILTESRSSMIGFMLIVLYFIAQSGNVKLKAAVYIGMILAVPIVVNTIFIKQGDLQEVLSMTGRLPFWKALLTEGLPKEPLFGFGYMRIAYTEAFQSAHTYAGKMTHNTFIQVLMNLGFVGFTIVLFQLFFTIKNAYKQTDQSLRYFFVGVFIPIMINSFTEFGVFGEANYGILFYQFLIVTFVIKLNEKLNTKELALKRIRNRKKEF